MRAAGPSPNRSSADVSFALKSHMRRTLAIVVAMALVLSARFAQAAPIQYVATDLGGGTWQYDYYLDSLSLNAQEGFRVYFDADYANLQILPPATPDWDVLVTDFDPSLSSLGTYDALALVDNPAFAGPFSVSFLWSGSGAPAEQPFDLYVLDSSGFPNAFSDGITSPRASVVNPVPEPATMLLLGTGLAIATRTLRRKRASSTV